MFPLVFLPVSRFRSYVLESRDSFLKLDPTSAIDFTLSSDDLSEF